MIVAQFATESILNLMLLFSSVDDTLNWGSLVLMICSLAYPMLLKVSTLLRHQRTDSISADNVVPAVRVGRRTTVFL